MGQLENAVNSLLQRNAQLQDQCAHMAEEKEAWQLKQRAMLAEVEVLLADLERLREQQG